MPEITIDTSGLSEDQVAALSGYSARRAERVDMKGPKGEKLNISRKAARLAEEAGYAIVGDSASADRAVAHLNVQGEKGYLGTAAVGGYSPPALVIGDAAVQTIEHALRTNPSLTRAIAEQIAGGLAIFPASPDAQAAERNAREDEERAKAGDEKKADRAKADSGVSQNEPLTDEQLDDAATTVPVLEEEAERLEVSKAGPKAELVERIKAARKAAG